jgi:small-conductance mechanosensitive channel
MMNYIGLPFGFLVLLILLLFLYKKQGVFSNLKNTFPLLYILVFISFLDLLINLNFVSSIINTSSISSVFRFCIFSVGIIFAVKLLSFFLFDFFTSQKNDIKYPKLIKDIVIIVLYVIGILIIAKYYFDFKITVFLASSAMITLVAGLALQDILGDLFSGIALNFEESLNIGDWVKIGEYEGKIEQFRWRSIKIKTNDHILIVIPNQVASKKEVVCFGQKKSFFSLRFTIGLSYKHNPDFVILVITDVLKTFDRIATEPKPQVMVQDFSDFTVNYEIRYWVNDYANRDTFQNEIKRRLWYAFKRSDIQIPFPIRDIYLHQPEPKPNYQEQIFYALKKNQILSILDESQLAHIAGDMDVKLYGKDDILIREGQKGQYFYLFLSGSAHIKKNNQVITSINSYDSVGEISLFTGESTTATVLIKDESLIASIDSEKFRAIVTLNETIAIKLSEMIAVRKTSLKKISSHEEKAKSGQFSKESENILNRIKKYFKI